MIEEIGSIFKIITLANQIKGTLNKIKDIEVKQMVSELVSEISDNQIALSELKIEAAKKDEKIHVLENQLKLKQEIIFDVNHKVYYRKEDIQKGQPICPGCFEVNGKLITLQIHTNNNNELQFFHCNVCEKDVYYKLSGYANIIS